MPFIVSVVQQKGGVGKTTLATSLFANAVCNADSRGIKSDSLGIMDLDPQGNATAWALGPQSRGTVRQHHGAEAFTLPYGDIGKRVFRGSAPPDDMSDHVLPCSRLGAGCVLPASQYMNTHAFQDVAFDAVPVRMLFVDTPPHLSTAIFRRVVAQSHVIIAPVQPEPYTLQNIPDLFQELADAGVNVEPGGPLRMVVTMRQKCANHDAWEAVLRHNWPHHVSPVVVPRAAAWHDVSNYGIKWNPKSAVAKLTASLWDDIENTLERRMAA
jgi:cellulose biosynthesis protein BcsQ